MTNSQTPWTNRFVTPSVEELRQDLPEPARALLDQLREELGGFDGMKEAAVWYGDPWRWVLEYRGTVTDEPLAVVIPNPEDLQVAMPIDQELAERLVRGRIKRAVRDGLDMVRAPFETRWSVWSVNLESLVEELGEVLNSKLEYLHQRAAS